MNTTPELPSGTEAPPWSLFPEDREFYERELATFVPGRVFDVHTHLWHSDHRVIPDVPEIGGYAEFRALIDQLHPGRQVSALFIPIAFDERAPLGNAWIAKHTIPNGYARRCAGSDCTGSSVIMFAPRRSRPGNPTFPSFYPSQL